MDQINLVGQATEGEPEPRRQNVADDACFDTGRAKGEERRRKGDVTCHEWHSHSHENSALTSSTQTAAKCYPRYSGRPDKPVKTSVQ